MIKNTTKTPDKKKAALMPFLEKESEKWKKLDEFKLEEEIIEEEEESLPPIVHSTPIKKSKRKSTSPLIKSKSKLKEIMFDDFLQEELGIEEIKKIKKEYLKDHLKHLPKEEGNMIIEKLKSEYVCSFFFLFKYLLKLILIQAKLQTKGEESGSIMILTLVLYLLSFCSNVIYNKISLKYNISIQVKRSYK